MTRKCNRQVFDLVQVYIFLKKMEIRAEVEALNISVHSDFLVRAHISIFINERKSGEKIPFSLVK